MRNGLPYIIMESGHILITKLYRKDLKEEDTMSFTFIKHLPTPDQIRLEHPLPERFAEIKRERDAEIRDVITG